MVNEKKLEALKQYLQQCVEEGIFPGCNCSVITKDDKWTCSVGYKQLVPEKEANGLDTIYDLASISKVLVTTTCILKLIEEGTITLKTKIADILPQFGQKELTIKDCITHSSGLPADINGYKQMKDDADMIEAVWKMELEYPTGTQVKYSDVNFILLGLVIAKLKGSLDGYAKQVMFDPLEMSETGYRPDASLRLRCCAEEVMESRGGVVRGVVHDGKAFKLGGVSGHAGVFSTLEDISHYITMLLNDGVYKGKQFFSKRTIELLQKCQTVGLNEKRSIGWVLSDPNYALGDYASDACLYHTGFSGPSIIVDFKLGIGVVTLTNRVHPSRSNTKILTARNNIHNLALQATDDIL